MAEIDSAPSLNAGSRDKKSASVRQVDVPTNFNPDLTPTKKSAVPRQKIGKDSSIALYADDSKLYRIINTPEDMSSFQGDLDKISDWCKENKMKINTRKCKIMRITRKRSPLVRDYHINGQSLESVHIYKDLGLLTSSSLSWNSHIDSITAKANKILVDW